MARFLSLGWLQLHRIKESNITRLVTRIDNEEKLKFFWLGVCLNFENAVQALNNSLLIQGSFRPQWILGPCKVNLDLKQVFLRKFVSVSISRHCHKVLKFLFTERTVESHGTGVCYFVLWNVGVEVIPEQNAQDSPPSPSLLQLLLTCRAET